MTKYQYRTIKLPELRAKRWRLAHDVATGWASIAKGTEVEIEYKRGGFTLRTKKCEKCRCQLIARKVHWEYVEEIPDGE